MKYGLDIHAFLCFLKLYFFICGFSVKLACTILAIETVDELSELIKAENRRHLSYRPKEGFNDTLVSLALPPLNRGPLRLQRLSLCRENNCKNFAN